MERHSGPDGLRLNQVSAAKTLVKGVALLKLVAANPGGLTLAEMSRRTGMPKPTAHRVLSALVEEGLLLSCHQGGYRLGPECLVLGTIYLSNLDLRSEASELLKVLVAATGETCHLGVRDGTRVVYIDKVESRQALRTHSRVGHTHPLHCTALGKAMLAFSEPEDFDRLVAGGLERRTPNTIVEPPELRAEMVRIRQRGYAVDDAETEEGIRCVGAPVFGHDGTVLAGISVTGPAQRLTDERIDDIATHLRAAAQELSRRLGHTPVGRLAKRRRG